MYQNILRISSLLLVLITGVSMALGDDGSDSETVSITIDAFSGLRNPVFEVDLRRSDDMTDTIRSLIDSVAQGKLCVSSLKKEEQYVRLGYHGIVITDPSGESIDSEISITVTKKYILVTKNYILKDTGEEGEESVYYNNDSFKKLEKDVIDYAHSIGVIGEKLEEHIDDKIK